MQNQIHFNEVDQTHYYTRMIWLVRILEEFQLSSYILLLLCALKLLKNYGNPTESFGVCEIFKEWFTTSKP